MTNPTEPTLACSEVVERLAIEAFVITDFDGTGYFDRELATAILHSWRERRVRELEKLLAKHSGCSHCNDSASDRTSSRTAKETR